MDESRSARARRMIVEVESTLQTQSGAQVAAEFAEWQKEFPRIFEMILTRNYDRGIMAMMLDQMDRVERGTVSRHNASVAVGGILVDKIVKPPLGNPRPANI